MNRESSEKNWAVKASSFTTRIGGRFRREASKAAKPLPPPPPPPPPPAILNPLHAACRNLLRAAFLNPLHAALGSLIWRPSPRRTRGGRTVRRVRFRLHTNTLQHTDRRTDKTPYEHRTNTVRDVRSAPLCGGRLVTQEPHVRAQQCSGRGSLWSSPPGREAPRCSCTRAGRGSQTSPA
jgi:hypothetical protein